MKRALLLLTFALVTGCTNGGVPTPSGGGGSPVTSLATIDVSIAAFGQASTPAGLALGYSPLLSTVQVGSGVQFVNVDNTSHTASSLSGTTFPAASPLTFAATSPFGAALSSGWSSGTLQAGARSAVFLADKPGTYLYGCFFHYSGTMRGMLVVQ
jgi:plastocyanin